MESDAQVLEGAPLATREMSPLAAIKSGLERMRPQLKVALPSHISPERFERTVLTALNNNPDLLSADRRSLFNACSKSAQDGLLPDGREGALVIFKDRSGRKLVQWMPMIAGIIKKIRQSGEIVSLGARIVYQAETVSPGLGLDGKPIPPRFRFLIKDGVETIEHEPMLWGERGPMMLVYAFAKHKGGTVEYEPLTLADVNKIKGVSKAKDKEGKPTGPWRDWFEEMAKKSALRRLSKRLPVSSEVMAALERDDEPSEFDKLKGEAIQSIGAAAAMMGAPQIGHDATTGEIVEPGTEEPDDETEGDELGEFSESDELDRYIEKMRGELALAKTPIEANAVDVTFRDTLDGYVERKEISEQRGTEITQAWGEATRVRAGELNGKKR